MMFRKASNRDEKCAKKYLPAAEFDIDGIIAQIEKIPEHYKISSHEPIHSAIVIVITPVIAGWSAYSTIWYKY